MRNLKTYVEKLRTDAVDCALIRDLATEKRKREFFAQLADHLSTLAREVEDAIDERRGLG